MKDFKKYFFLKAAPKDVYNAMTNQKMLEIWTGEPAVMEEIPESEFSLWDGSIIGKNIEFIKNEKIVQQWYFEGEQEKSVVIIKLFDFKNGTSVELYQTNIPDEAFENICSGWETDYFDSLKQLFE